MVRIPEIYRLAGLPFAAYLLGCILAPLSDLAVAKIPALLSRLYEAVRGKLPRVVRYRLPHASYDASAIRGPVLDVISAAYAKTGLPSDASFAFPLDDLLARFDSISLQLWHKSPSQYQEYDRLRAEAAFRRGVTLPIVALSVLTYAAVGWPSAAVSAIAVIALALQAGQLDHRRNVLIANALHQGLIEDPPLTLIVGYLSSLKMPRKYTRPVLHSATAAALWHLGDFEAADFCINEILSEMADEAGDLEEPARSARLRELQRDVTSFLASHGAGDLGKLLPQRMERLGIVAAQ
jgi:hypothetical protein